MNKQLITVLAVMALVAVAFGAPPTGHESEETVASEAPVATQNPYVFQGFCQQVRADLKAKLTDETNKAAAGLYLYFTREFSSIVNTVGEQGAAAVQEEVKQIEQDSGKLFAGFKNVFFKVADFTGDALVKFFVNFGNLVQAKSMLEQGQKGCTYLQTTLTPEYQEKFNQYKEQLKTSGLDSNQLALVEGTTYESVECEETGLLQATHKSCDAILKLTEKDLPRIGSSNQDDDSDDETEPENQS